MDAEVRNDDIEAGVRERHGLRTYAHQRATIGDAFEREVVQRRSLGVATHVDVRPDVDTRSMTGRKTLRHASQQHPTTTAHIQHLFVTAPRMHCEHEVPM